MMLVGSALKGYAIEASDGRIGAVSDFLFDDRSWAIRWMVVDTGTWLAGRKTLIHPSAITSPDYALHEIAVRLTRQQVKDSPDILSDAPVSRQMETNLYGHYGWDPLWVGGNYLANYASGMGGAFEPAEGRFDAGLLEAGRAASGASDSDPRLRSLTSVIGYHIQASDGPIGHVESFLVDDESWTIRYLIIDTKNWWPGRHVVMSPYAVRGISWTDRDVTLNVSQAAVEASPVWDPATMIHQAYEEDLHRHYGWPGHGW